MCPAADAVEYVGVRSLIALGPTVFTVLLAAACVHGGSYVWFS